MKAKTSITGIKGIFVLVMMVIVIAIAGCSKKENPKPVTVKATVTISEIVATTQAPWKTQSVIATKADGTTVNLNQETIDQNMYVDQPAFDLVTQSTNQDSGTGGDVIFGEAFNWSYNSTTQIINIDLPFAATISQLDAHTMVWTTTDHQGFAAGTYTKFVQTFTR